MLSNLFEVIQLVRNRSRFRIQFQFSALSSFTLNSGGCDQLFRVERGRGGGGGREGKR